MLRALYDWVMGLAARRDAVWVLALIAFIESSVFPIPPDVLLIPMVLAARTRAWRFALVCTVASALGGVFGYAIGYFLFETVGRPIVEFYGATEEFSDLQRRYNEWGAWIVFTAGFTPIPYKLFTIASGVSQLDLTQFTVASVVGRGLRFYLVAALLWWIGPPVRDFIERRLGLMTALFCILLVGGFAVAKYAL